ncbi:MAG: antibiotic biosynthesis monooxygenase [Leptospiraceae bacterium]|nr:antibiotic biosynthesis monooxygenase [Leptospiraceae bacterium]
MITEIAILNINHLGSKSFEESFKKAEKIISKMNGYISHRLLKCIEEDLKYLLIVHWEKLEDHTEGFRNSEEYKEWKSLLHKFYDPFPIVEHYFDVSSLSKKLE